MKKGIITVLITAIVIALSFVGCKKNVADKAPTSIQAFSLQKIDNDLSLINAKYSHNLRGGKTTQTAGSAAATKFVTVRCAISFDGFTALFTVIRKRVYLSSSLSIAASGVNRRTQKGNRRTG